MTGVSRVIVLVLLIAFTGCLHRLPANQDPADEVTVPDLVDQDPDPQEVQRPDQNPPNRTSQPEWVAPWLTRDDFARLMYERFKDLFPNDSRLPVMIDLDRSTQQEALIAVVGAGLISVGRDHRVFPEARIRKLDIARSLWQVMDLAGYAPDPAIMQAVEPPTDLSRAHAALKEVTGCLAVGLLTSESDGRFQSGKILTGQEILTAIELLQEHLSDAEN